MGYNPEHYQANKEQYAAKARLYRENNREKLALKRRAYYEKNKEREMQYSTQFNRKRRCGIIEEEYQTLLQKQQGVCAICSQKCSRALAVDHCHTTGKIRGLLCNNCNRGIGHLKDNITFLEKAIIYLKDSYGS